MRSRQSRPSWRSHSAIAIARRWALRGGTTRTQKRAAQHESGSGRAVGGIVVVRSAFAHGFAFDATRARNLRRDPGGQRRLMPGPVPPEAHLPSQPRLQGTGDDRRWDAVRRAMRTSSRCQLECPGDAKSHQGGGGAIPCDSATSGLAPFSKRAPNSGRCADRHEIDLANHEEHRRVRKYAERGCRRHASQRP